MGRKHLSSIVLRLDDEEREILKILEAALRVSEYTDDIDGYRLSYRREEKMISAMGELFTTIAGLSTILPEVAADVKERLQRSTSVAALEPVLARAFEIARRHKRINPEKMRSEYGKLVMLLQDAVRVRGELRMDLVTPIRTVGAALDALGAAELLNDPALNIAVKPLPAGFTGAQQEAKERAFSALIEKYGTPAGPSGAAAVGRCLWSVSDAIALIEGNRSLIRRLIGWLDELFKEPTRETDLSIRAGTGGAMLTHSHDQQYRYVKEALTLWDIVQRDIFDFWECVEDDMLVSHPQYSMRNTGQGINRVSRGPGTHARMSAAVAEAHNTMGGWVGIKVIHMGDDDVPNPLVFVDKYTIIPKLVGPIVRTIAEISDLLGAPNAASLGASGDNAATVVAPEGFGPERYPGYKKLLLSGFESAHALRVAILRDFFRYGFDGSGDDGGACIDGRLTSAWNWCSNIAKKPFYQAFLLTGFVGFDTNFH